MIRLLLAAPFSMCMAIVLFSMMGWMVNNGHNTTPKKSEPFRFNMVMMEERQTSHRRERAVPERPKPPEAPTQNSLDNIQTDVQPISALAQQLNLSLDTNINGLAINAPELGSLGVSQQALPLYRVEPRYPSRALNRNLSGYVVLNFTIDPSGKPDDITVVDAHPQGIFEREAISALRQWKYQPKVEAGKALAQFGQTVKLEFKLAQ